MITQTQARPIAAPSALLAMTEWQRALGELSALPLAAPLLMQAPRGDGHPVLVLPAFCTSDASTRLLRQYLTRLGYDVHAWDLGRNLGPKAIGRDGSKLAARLKCIHEQTGRKVSLVGWSLGGVMARELARQAPHAVRQIVTLGSPFTGDPRASSIAWLYEKLSGDRLDDAGLQARLAESRTAPPVPSTAIYTKADGITAWRNCIEPASDHTDNIEVHGSHCGLTVNACALYAVADRLAQPEGRWTPFDRRGCRAAFYPSSGHLH